jgi:hypothetical protein
VAEVKVAGEWLHSRGNVSDIAWSSRWGSGPCGGDLASCVFAVDPDNDTSLVGVGSSFEVYSGGVLEFGGVVDEVSRDFPRQIAAKGLARRAEDFEALSGGSPTSSPQDAVEDAITRGLPWSDAGDFGPDPIGSVGDSVRRLDELLTDWADKVGVRWGVDPTGVAFAVAEPTDVDYLLNADGFDIGVTSDNLATHIVARYQDGVDFDGNPTFSTTVASDTDAEEKYGRREKSLDLTNLGLLTSGTAGTYATAELALGLRPRWLQRVTVPSSRLLSPGGVPAHLPSVRAGQVVRLFNLPANLGGTRFSAAVDAVLGEVSYSTADPAQITLGPTNLSVRTLSDAIAAARR